MVASRPTRLRLVAVALFGASCGPTSTTPDAVSLAVTPSAGLAVGIGGTQRFVATTLDAAGAAILVADARWTTADPAVATIDGRGLATAVSEGRTEIVVSVGGLEARGELVVYVPEPVAVYEPGTIYSGRNGYVEYVPGTLPIVLAAPHGGRTIPTEIPRHPGATQGLEPSTLELAVAVRAALLDLTGAAPHMVLNRVDPGRLDPNLDLEDGGADPFATHAWNEYHAYVELARRSIEGAHGGGLFVDVHAHEHPGGLVEIGYLLGPEQYDRPDASLNSLATVQLSSVREIGRTRPDSFAAVLRGPTSLGALLESAGYPALPSPTRPSPGGIPYVSGSYATARHGSQGDTELVSGVHVAHPSAGVLEAAESRAAYAAALAGALRSFMLTWFGFFEEP